MIDFWIDFPWILDFKMHPKMDPKRGESESRSPFFAFHNASKIKPRFFNVLGCLWEPFAIAQVSFFIDFGGLLAHLAASFTIQGPVWLSLAENEPRTSRESERTAENQPRTVENQPRTSREPAVRTLDKNTSPTAKAKKVLRSHSNHRREGLE